LTCNLVYIRFEPAGASPNWNLSFAAALVYADQFFVGYTPPIAFDNLWLGDPLGNVLYLTDEHWSSDRTVLDVGRQIAAQMGKNGSRN
jgi:hypothetical protein